MLETRISWAHGTWNPFTGCQEAGKECIGCYAKAMLERQGRNFHVLALTQTWNMPYELDAQAKLSNSRAICFVCSLSDFFHTDADLWRRDAWQVIHDCKHTNFMLLTKRPERILECLPDDWKDGQAYPNAWLGATCGVRESYSRIDILRSIPCSLRFLSAEPLMESLADINLDGIGWVAAGGMSGPLHQKHKMQISWAAEIHDHCRALKIPFLFKQASAVHSEHGVNSLSIYLAKREGKSARADRIPLIREYPRTTLPLLPFIEQGVRFTAAEYEKY